MRHLLGNGDYAQFAESLAGEAHCGLRINTLKVTIADFISKTPFRLSPVGEFEPAGWVLVTVDGHTLGWAKRVNGRLKNHFPCGLRRAAAVGR